MIITVSREFGSGGRELGKRLSDELNIAYYDREIIIEVAKRGGFSEAFVENASEKGLFTMPVTFCRTLTSSPILCGTMTEILIQQQKLLREIATHGDCVIVGRGANVVLKEEKPFNLFVYADVDAKLERCKARASEEEKSTLSDKEMLKKMKRVDADRQRFFEMISGKDWGSKENYNLLINTSKVEIKSIVPAVASYIKSHYGK